MTDSEYKNYRAEQILSQCGLSEDSINSIKSTRIVTHNGAQHVIHNSQSHLFENQNTNTSNTPNTSIQMINNDLMNELASQQQQFARFKQFADARIMKLENQMGHVLEQLKLSTEIIQTLKSNSEASFNRAKLAEGTARKDPVTQAIDRNNVAPADVCIEKMFYFGYK